MEKEIEIPEGYEARIEGNKVIIEPMESEDEKIRKWLISYMNNELDDAEFTAGGAQMAYNAIAWLEKQKEPIPIPDKFSGLKSLMLQYLYSAANRKDDTEIESDTDLWGRKILDYVWKYDGLQKEQKPLPGFDELTPDEKMNHPLYLEGFDVGRKVGQVEAGQKPTEWSDEDNRKIAELKTFIAQCNGFNKANRQKAFDMIDAFRPQPHWKPSEEQMDALQYALGAGGVWGKKALESLYEQLKKF